MTDYRTLGPEGLIRIGECGGTIGSSGLTILKFTMHDLSESGVTKTIQAPDRVKFLHIDIPVGHAGWVDMEMGNLPDEKRVLVGRIRSRHALTFELDRHLADTRRRDFDRP